MTTRIALAQINPTVGDIRGNLQIIRQTLKLTPLHCVVPPSLEREGGPGGEFSIRSLALCWLYGLGL